MNGYLNDSFVKSMVDPGLFSYERERERERERAVSFMHSLEIG